MVKGKTLVSIAVIGAIALGVVLFGIDRKDEDRVQKLRLYIEQSGVAPTLPIIKQEDMRVGSINFNDLEFQLMYTSKDRKNELIIDYKGERYVLKFYENKRLYLEDYKR